MVKKLKNGEEGQFIFNQKAVKYLADTVNNSSLSQIEYTCGQITIKISKNMPQQQQMVPMPVLAPAQHVVPTSAHASAVAALVAHVPEAPAQECTITAPVVGKVYVAAKPGDEPFIKIGDRIKEGQVIFIIEAMKVMNNVKADKSGVVKEIFIKDTQPVEYGQKLLSLE